MFGARIHPRHSTHRDHEPQAWSADLQVDPFGARRTTPNGSLALRFMGRVRLWGKNLRAKDARFSLRTITSLVLTCRLLGWVCFARAAEPDKANDSNRAAIAAEALSRLKGIDLEANPGVRTAVMKVLDQVRGTPQFVEIVRDFKIQGQDEPLLEIAVKYPDDSTGVEATRLILAGRNFGLLKGSLAGANAARVAEALGHTGQRELVPLLEPVVADTRRDLALRKQAVRALAQVQEGAAALLRLAKEEKLPDDLKPLAGSELGNARWAKIKAEAAQILPVPQGRDSQPLPPVSQLVRMHGDAMRGAEVFRRDTVGCIKCHQVNGDGIEFGPNLSEIGTKLGKEALFEAILDPSAGISFGYEAWQIELKNGDEAYGLIVSETADEVALKTQGGIVTRYKKSDIARREQQKLSIMPAGLQQALSTQDLVDLVEYLASLKKAAK